MAGKPGMKGGGGVRAGAGRKPAKPRKRTAKAYQTTDPDEFLRAVMADPNADFKDRMAAAFALKKSGKTGPQGKKEQQQAAANAIVERNLAPVSAPTKARPKLVAVK